MTRLDRLRKVCLGLPEATEQPTWEVEVTFRVRSKIFAITGPDAASVTLKATRQDQEALVASHPRVGVAPYVGRFGWVAVDLTGTGLDWSMVEEMVRESYVLVAPKSLATGV